MIKKTRLPDAIEQFALEMSTPETPVQRRLRERTAQMPNANMQIGRDQAAFFSILARFAGVRRALEVGTFTGYSALAVALALPDDGKLVACDVSREWTDIGRESWREAGVEGKIELRIGPASESLDRLLAEGAGGSFDFAFIDADKGAYPGYYEQCLKLVRPGGLIALDNMLRRGEVVDETVNDPETRTIRALNAAIRDDRRVDACLLTLGDGVMLARRRA
jgi:predicted O-methyltransferase YrrM